MDTISSTPDTARRPWVCHECGHQEPTEGAMLVHLIVTPGHQVWTLPDDDGTAGVPALVGAR